MQDFHEWNYEDDEEIIQLKDTKGCFIDLLILGGLVAGFVLVVWIIKYFLL